MSALTRPSLASVACVLLLLACFAASAQGTSRADDHDPLVEELRAHLDARWAAMVVDFCRDRFREAEASERRGSGGIVDYAADVCRKCTVARCREYDRWALERTREAAVDIRECLNRRLRADEVRRCRLRLSLALDNW
jgi:hypothetical protein